MGETSASTMENKQFATINFRIHDRLPELVKAREKVEANTEALNAILATLKDITNRCKSISVLSASFTLDVLELT